MTAVSNEFYQGAPLLDFENSYKNRTSALMMNTASNLWQDNASLAGQKDNTPQNISLLAHQKQQASTTHYIQANIAASSL